MPPKTIDSNDRGKVKGLLINCSQENFLHKTGNAPGANSHLTGHSSQCLRHCLASHHTQTASLHHTVVPCIIQNFIIT
ncbi:MULTISPECIES: hypothetical protein [unclassified Bartonella]|uniref:hypothetical protein n=1 Tax=unclassified Bartonella TaxID=2645622 RepID=UPI0035CED947